MKEASAGDIVRVNRYNYTIAKVYSQSYWDRFGWDIEFVDTSGGYHHWKQYEDGGELIQK